MISIFPFLIMINEEEEKSNQHSDWSSDQWMPLYHLQLMIFFDVKCCNMVQIAKLGTLGQFLLNRFPLPLTLFSIAFTISLDSESLTT